MHSTENGTAPCLAGTVGRLQRIEQIVAVRFSISMPGDQIAYPFIAPQRSGDFSSDGRMMHGEKEAAIPPVLMSGRAYQQPRCEPPEQHIDGSIEEVGRVSTSMLSDVMKQRCLKQVGIGPARPGHVSADADQMLLIGHGQIEERCRLSGGERRGYQRNVLIIDLTSPQVKEHLAQAQANRLDGVHGAPRLP